MKKIFFVSVILLFAEAVLTAQTKKHVVPMLGFQMLQTDEKDFVLSPSAALQYMCVENLEDPSSDGLVLAAGYALNHHMQALGPESVKNTHSINLFGSYTFGKNNFVGIVNSEGEIPFSSIQAVNGGVMYTRQLVKTDNISFVFGAGIIVGDLGLKIKDLNIYCLPLPVFSFNYKNDIVDASVSLLGLPSLSLTLFPEAMVRFKGSCGLAGLKSVRDITFDCALVYYPFLKTKTKDMIYISAGIMNTVSNTVLRDKIKYGFQYYSVYGEVSATLVTLRCGYNYNGTNRIDDETVSSLYKGFFGSLTAMYMF